MSLLRYEEALPWANAVKLMVLERRMPPFLPDEDAGSWRGARGLTAREVDVLVEWASGGTPRGEGPDEGQEAPTPPEPPADLVLSALRDSVLGPEEAERSDCVVFPVRLSAERPLAAIELRPGNASIVRSAVIYLGDTCREGDRPVATWLPGDGAFEMPEGTAEVLHRGASLSARIQYRKPWRLQGQPARDRSQRRPPLRGRSRGAPRAREPRGRSRHHLRARGAPRGRVPSRSARGALVSRGRTARTRHGARPGHRALRSRLARQVRGRAGARAPGRDAAHRHAGRVLDRLRAGGRRPVQGFTTAACLTGGRKPLTSSRSRLGSAAAQDVASWP